MEACTRRIIGFKIHVGAKNDAPALRKFLGKLKTKGKIKFGDIVVTDRGSTCMLNYLYALNVAEVVPVPQPRRNVSPSKVLSQVSPSLEASTLKGVLLRNGFGFTVSLRSCSKLSVFSALRIELNDAF